MTIVSLGGDCLPDSASSALHFGLIKAFYLGNILYFALQLNSTAMDNPLPKGFRKVLLLSGFLLFYSLVGFSQKKDDLIPYRLKNKWGFADREG